MDNFYKKKYNNYSNGNHYLTYQHNCQYYYQLYHQQTRWIAAIYYVLGARLTYPLYAFYFTCHKQFEMLQCNGLPVACPICVNIRLNTYYQSDEDVEFHRNCYKNFKRMFYHCQCCNGYFCPCVEKQLKKKITLQSNNKFFYYKSLSTIKKKAQKV